MLKRSPCIESVPDLLQIACFASNAENRENTDCESGLGQLQVQGNRLQLLENTMITIMITVIMNVIDYIVK